MYFLVRSRWSIPLLLLGIIVFAPQLHAAFDPIKLKSLRQQAEFHEQQGEWDKACLIYESILRLDRAAPGIKERYARCLRRYWQVKRHSDLSYRKEVLSLDYAQSLRLYTLIRDTLLDNVLDKQKADPGRLFRQGLEEFDNALTDPYFLQEYLPGIRPSAIRVFRDFLRQMWGQEEKLTREKALKQLREVALASQSVLQLNCNVVFMEFACGACYALDDYTLYLTPAQLRELCDSLRGEVPDAELTFRPSVACRMENDHVGYLQIVCFQESTVQEIDDALDSLSKDGMRVLILDLRGNGGGVFEAAIEVARRFLSSGIIASTQNSDPKFNSVYQARNANALAVPMVIMIDGETASAAEVLAGALKDNKRGRLIGQTTFGKGCTQCILKLPPALGGVPTGGMRLTVARFFSPDGLSYTGQGVTPHIAIDPLIMGSKSELDRQVDAALLEADRLLIPR